MKKIISLVAAILVSATSFAQLIFVDANGKEIPDGTTVTMKDAVFDDIFDEWHINLDGVSVKNTTSEKQSFTMKVTANTLPNGYIGCCFGMTCQNISIEGRSVDLKNLSLNGNATQLITNTEWVPNNEEYGVANVDFQIVGGPKITVKFVYSNSERVIGDVNGDGVVDIADVNAVLTVMFSEEDYTQEADVNEDDVVDIADVNAVLTIMFED